MNIVPEKKLELTHEHKLEEFICQIQVDMEHKAGSV